MFYGILLQIDRVDYQVTSPMFPNELNALLEAESKPKPIFYRAAYSDYFIKVSQFCYFFNPFDYLRRCNWHKASTGKVEVGKSQIMVDVGLSEMKRLIFYYLEVLITSLCYLRTFCKIITSAFTTTCFLNQLFHFVESFREKMFSS